MVGRAVHDRPKHCRHSEAAVVDRHGPDVDGDVQHQVEHLVQWEEEGVDVVRDALQETIDRVKRMTGVRRRHLPRMMRLVYGGVDEAMMKPAVYPVDETISEQDERQH